MYGCYFNPRMTDELSRARAMTIPSLWSVVLARGLLTSTPLTRVARGAADQPEDWPRFAVLGLLSVLLFSRAAKYPSWLMTDITASWLYLAGALWLLAPGKLDRGFAFGIAGVAILAHNSEPPLALATSLVIGGVSLWPAMFGSSVNGRDQGRAWLMPFLIAIAGCWTWGSVSGAVSRPKRG